MSDCDYIVYCHRNKTDGKKYYGITSQTPSRRWRNGKGYERNPYFAKAIKKYGWEGFEHIIIFRACSKEIAEAIEQDLIKTGRTQDHSKGYNIESGGNAHDKVSDETRAKQSAIHKGVESAFKGHKHTEESKAKMSKAHKGKPCKVIRFGKDNPLSKTIIGTHKTTGEKIRCVGVCEAGRIVGVAGSNISSCLTHPTHTAGGYFWKYEE